MKSKSIFQNQMVMVLTALFCNFLWGSAFPAIKIGYQLFHIAADDISSQILFAGVRFTLAGILTLIMGSALARHILLPGKASWKYIGILALFQTILQYFFFYIALARTSGVKSSIIEASGVFLSILFSAAFLRDTDHIAWKLFWCIPGFAGVMLVNLNGSSLSLDMKWNGEGFILISTAAASIASVLMKKFSAHDSPVLLSGWQFICGGSVLSLIGLITGGRLSCASASGWLLIGYLAFVSAAAYSLWGILLKYHPVSQVAVFSFSNPVFGVLLSSLFLHESPGSYGWKLPAALGLVCIGIAMANRTGRRD